jgi:hypothetical protein
MKRYIFLFIMLLFLLNIGLAKQSFTIDFSKNPPKGNLVFEMGKGVVLEKGDGEYHLAMLRAEGQLRLYTPVTSLSNPKRVVLKITGMSSSFMTEETWAPVSIYVNSKNVISGFDFGSDYYITPSFDITKYWIAGQTNIIEIILEKDASGEFWLKKLELIIYER